MLLTPHCPHVHINTSIICTCHDVNDCVVMFSKLTKHMQSDKMQRTRCLNTTIAVVHIISLPTLPQLSLGLDIRLIAKSWSCEVGCCNNSIAIEFDSYLDSAVAEASVIFRRDWKSLKPNLCFETSPGLGIRRHPLGEQTTRKKERFLFGALLSVITRCRHRRLVWLGICLMDDALAVQIFQVLSSHMMNNTTKQITISYDHPRSNLPISNNWNLPYLG